MRKFRPFRVVFAVIQCLLLLALMLLPGYFAAALDEGLGGLLWLILFLIAAFCILFADAVWVAVVLRRYHARHREVPPVRALLAWGGYLTLIVIGAPCVNFMVLLGGVPPLTVKQWAIAFSLWFIPALILIAVLWAPALLLSLLDSKYCYTPKKTKPQA